MVDVLYEIVVQFFSLVSRFVPFAFCPSYNFPSFLFSSSVGLSSLTYYFSFVAISSI